MTGASPARIGRTSFDQDLVASLLRKQCLPGLGERRALPTIEPRVVQVERRDGVDDRCGDDTRVNHLLSAGTTYHGACGADVARIMSS